MFSRLAAATYGLRGAVSGVQSRGSIPEPTQLLISTPAGITDNDIDDLNAKLDRRQPTKFQCSLMISITAWALDQMEFSRPELCDMCIDCVLH